MLTQSALSTQQKSIPLSFTLTSKKSFITSAATLFFLLFSLVSFKVSAESFKFKIKNTTKNVVTVFYKINKKSGDFKVRSLVKLAPGDEREKEVSIGKNDTVSFYGQNGEDETSAIVRKDYETLNKDKNEVYYIPIVIPEKENTSFESVENLGLQLEHNKVLSFLLRMDSTSMTSMSMLENNFQNIYPLGTFVFVDTKTNRLLVPPLEPSYWNNSENYFTIQDSLYALVNNNHALQAGVQVSFIAKLFDSLRVNNAEELEFKGKLSLFRWKPSPNANIYQILNDKAIQDFLQICYDQINDPDSEYQHYRLYFLSSYERIDDLEIYGKQFYSFGNEADISLMSSGNPNFQLLSTNLGMLYTKSKTLSNYYSVQNAVLRTRAYDFTSLLFNGFKNNIKTKLIEDAYRTQHQLVSNILSEYSGLVDYNPDPSKLTLVKLNEKDTTSSLTPVLTTVGNLQPYIVGVADTSKEASAIAKNNQLDGYNNRVKIFNSHLSKINSLIKQLNQTNSDIVKMSQSDEKQYKMDPKNSAGLLKEIVVNNSIVRKE
ncbi:hypothetical protein JN11_03180 [Mucilaginibacter frigoritolerans]|uniref:Uncharacterized protein n=1 Tax=Mucilaginibacter frigoritolerans TaxID=652788 RepID=A0A562TWY1_9SPHI|nr:hypothetical protein [Mucilaginibacter frigoritolerans]TWI98101.1 hypothetical protein JN11_03180 [Mucilaginibacter frigoritolerans]